MSPSRAGSGLRMLACTLASKQDRLRGSRARGGPVPCKRNESPGGIGAVARIREDFRARGPGVVTLILAPCCLTSRLHSDIRAIGRDLSTSASLDFDRCTVSPSLSPPSVPIGEEE